MTSSSAKTEDDTEGIVARRARHLERTVLDKYKPMMRKVFAGTASPRNAIKMMCLDCCGGDIECARLCTVVICPLWEYNGYRLLAVAAAEKDE